MNTKTCIFTRGYSHSWKYCIWCSFGEIKFDLTLKKIKYPLFMAVKCILPYLKARNFVLNISSKIQLMEILTYLAYRAIVKHRVLFCNNSLGGNAWRYSAPYYDVILPIDHIALTLDGVTTFLRVINVRNTCKRLRYNQTFGGISSVQWRTESEGYNCFFIVSCVLESK